MSLFKLRGDLSKSQSLILGVVGFVIILIIWSLLANAFSEKVPVGIEYSKALPSTIGLDSLEKIKVVAQIDSIQKADSIAFANASQFETVYPILPKPLDVVKALPKMVKEDKLISNTLISIWRNVQGYIWAILICIPIGFLIGLLPIFRGMFSKPVDALRYLPLTALTGLFMAWFGTQEKMKVLFLAFGIIVYLLPIVAQRVNEVREVFLKTSFTLGATDWQTIKTVYIPSVMSKLIDDIRVLTAISWTYIIIAELLNKEGGIGALMYNAGRQSQTQKVFAGLIVIVLVGFLQDRIFAFIDKRMFPHKYYATNVDGIKESQYGIYSVLGILILLVIISVLIPSIASTMQMIAMVVAVSGLLFIFFGEFKIFKSTRNA